MELHLINLFQKIGYHPQGIIHVGASSGQERGQYDAMQAKQVLWIEGDPDTAKWLYENYKGDPRHEVISACIFDTCGPATFYRMSIGDASSLLEYDVEQDILGAQIRIIGTVPVKTTTLAHVMDGRDGFDTLVMDIQGAELQALKGLGDGLEAIQAVVLETCTGEAYRGQATETEVDEWLQGRGFREYFRVRFNPKMTESDALYVRPNLLES